MIEKCHSYMGTTKGPLALACNPEYHIRTKYIDIQIDFIQELVVAGKVYLKYYPSPEMIVDIITKQLSHKIHPKLTTAMGIMDETCRSYKTLREGVCWNFHKGSIWHWGLQEVEDVG